MLWWLILMTAQPEKQCNWAHNKMLSPWCQMPPQPSHRGADVSLIVTPAPEAPRATAAALAVAPTSRVAAGGGGAAPMAAPSRPVAGAESSPAGSTAAALAQPPSPSAELVEPSSPAAGSSAPGGVDELMPLAAVAFAPGPPSSAGPEAASSGNRGDGASLSAARAEPDGGDGGDAQLRWGRSRIWRVTGSPSAAAGLAHWLPGCSPGKSSGAARRRPPACPETGWGRTAAWHEQHRRTGQWRGRPAKRLPSEERSAALQSWTEGSHRSPPRSFPPLLSPKKGVINSTTETRKDVLVERLEGVTRQFTIKMRNHEIMINTKYDDRHLKSTEKRDRHT